MGIFDFFKPKPKLTQVQLQQINTLMEQARQSADLVDTTVNPDVFFGRLNFLLDIYLELSTFEKYNCFTTITPTKEYQELINNNLEKIVDTFIERSYNDILDKINKLKTESGRKKRFAKYTENMLNCFENCHTFYQGNKAHHQHYNGILYTQNNLEKLKNLLSNTLLS